MSDIFIAVGFSQRIKDDKLIGFSHNPIKDVAKATDCIQFLSVS
jgi:hypothetical protein